MFQPVEKTILENGDSIMLRFQPEKSGKIAADHGVPKGGNFLWQGFGDSAPSLIFPFSSFSTI